MPLAEWPQAPQFIEAVPQPEISKSVEKLSDQMNQIIRKFNMFLDQDFLTNRLFH